MPAPVSELGSHVLTRTALCPTCIQYNLFLQDNKRFLLAARKRKKQTTSNYLASLDYDDLERDSPNYFGKVLHQDSYARVDHVHHPALWHT